MPCWRAVRIALLCRHHASHATPICETDLCQWPCSYELQAMSMQVLAINKRVQAQNNAPPGFPNFVRQGYEIAILADDYQESNEGLIWKVSRRHLAQLCKPHHISPTTVCCTIWTCLRPCS